MEAHVCDPSVFTPAERARHDRLVQELFEVARPDPQSPEVFHFPPEDAWVMKVAGWLTLERRCCPHFRFQVEVGRGSLSLRVESV